MDLYAHIKENYAINDKDFLLQDDGDGCYLKKWDSELTPPIALGEIWVDDGNTSDSQKKAELQEYWDSLEITVNNKTFIADQNNCTLMELKKATLMDAEESIFPAKYGFVSTNKIELQQVLNQVSSLIDVKKLEIWGA